ncbi:MAG: class I SAM-dependent methyltransferase [Candidatus Eremiobacteraeota bacterium]|nr:class I SAM-dependent methyltransferase [Candidatus Eremiobacteraeota bacterium]
MHLRHRQSCRVCGSACLTKVIDLGDQYLQGSFVKADQPSPPLRRLPTSLVRCDPMRDESACGLLQMEYTVPPSILYSSYWYRSGTNQTMRDHLGGIVEQATAMSSQPTRLVLDIGCNDGTLLSNYPTEVEKVGIDPSVIGREVNLPNTRVINDLFPCKELTSVLGGRRFDVVTAIAMFYDLEAPVDFVRNIAEVLAPEGLWVFEMSYMPTMLKKTSYDTICHEHLEYYSLAVIERILEAANMKVVRAELNDSNGGSLRCFATHSTNFSYKNADFQTAITRLRESEFDLALDTDTPYRQFQERINVHREELSQLLWGLKREGKKIHIYGASTKGNTILQWCGLDNRVIDYAAERNPDKFGAKTLGTDIPIISEADSRAMKPDFYLVLPWHFREEFVQREKDTVAGGTGLIFPLPTIEIYR